MKQDVFEELLNRRVNLIRQTLSAKAKEYAADEDRLHNFKEAAKLEGSHPADALRGMMLKHWVSIQDMVKYFGELGYNEPPIELSERHAMIDEKIGDAINYLILLEAILRE